jgi:hypothetical protein
VVVVIFVRSQKLAENAVILGSSSVNSPERLVLIRVYFGMGRADRSHSGSHSPVRQARLRAAHFHRNDKMEQFYQYMNPSSLCVA